MMNLKIDVEISNKQYPIIFEGVYHCLKCGAQDSLIFVDKFGNRLKDRSPVHELCYMECKYCREKFGIEWRKDKDGPGFHPCAIKINIPALFLHNFWNNVSNNIKGK